MAEMLLLSNSTAPGRGFLEPALGVIAQVMHGRRRLLFVALASSDPVRYTQMMRGCLAQIGIRVEGADAAGSLRRASAGANLACPTIRTTNDMPIVDPGSFRALGLIPFQVNAHYPYDEPAGSPAGETRQQRIAELLEEIMSRCSVCARAHGCECRGDGHPRRSSRLPAIPARRRNAGASPGIRRLRALGLPVAFDTREPARESAASRADPR